jgi:asparagine synthase (glutamine-hydrolysing)
MLRYICLAWNARDHEASRRFRELRSRFSDSSKWKCPLDRDGLFVAYVTVRGQIDEALPLGDDRGVLLGTAFRSHSGDFDRRFRPSAREVDSLAQSAARRAIDEIWGSYVLIVQDPAQRSVYVLRAPMGQLPCFYGSVGEVTVLFSDVEDFIQLGAATLTINWNCIIAQATNRDYLTRETAIREITSLESGECLRLGTDRPVLSTYWSPCSVSRLPEILDFKEAAGNLRKQATRCVRTWASQYQTILHTLSGGLDSSIVLSCLVAGEPTSNVTCLNQYSKQRQGDERRYARSMAERAHVPLIELERDRDVSLSRFLDCAVTARPVLHFTGCESYPASVRIAQRVGATAIFNGELGDQVFGGAAGHEFVTEHLWKHGARSSLLSVALDFALLKRVCVWKVAYRAMRDNWIIRNQKHWSMYDYMRRVMNSEPMDKGLISPEALHEYIGNIPRFIHPWLQDIQGVPPGRYLFIFSIIAQTSTAYQEPFAHPGDPDIISPLTGQPLVDCSLRISSPLHIAGGIDRAAARFAFGPDLSTLVLTRRGKGSPTGWIQETTRRNVRFLEEYLLDGILVRERILDRKKVEAILRGIAGKSLVSITDVFLQLYIEAWLRRLAVLMPQRTGRATDLSTDEIVGQREIA